MRFSRIALLVASIACVSTACFSSTDSQQPAADAATAPTADSGVQQTQDSAAPTNDAGSDVAVADAADAAPDSAVVLPPGLLDPIPYLSRDDSPFIHVNFPSFIHFEDWEDGLVNTPGVTSTSNQLGSAFGSTLIDSVDGDDGTVDGKCQKIDGTCNSGFASGTIGFTFDATVLGALPTHVGIAWTDGSQLCDAIFEAYDADDVLLGSKTATAVGDEGNNGTVAEDRFFGVVHLAGVKRIVVKSSAGGVEVDHLQYGR